MLDISPCKLYRIARSSKRVALLPLEQRKRIRTDAGVSIERMASSCDTYWRRIHLFETRNGNAQDRDLVDRYARVLAYLKRGLLRDPDAINRRRLTRQAQDLLDKDPDLLWRILEEAERRKGDSA